MGKASSNDRATQKRASCPLFTVILPVGADAEALKCSIDSLVGQTVGFEEKIQLVLVGSHPGTRTLCEESMARWSANILLLPGNAEGLEAWTTGIAVAAGDIIVFMEAGGIWSADSFSCVEAYFARHNEIDIALCERSAVALCADGPEREVLIRSVAEQCDPLLDPKAGFFRRRLLEELPACGRLLGGAELLTLLLLRAGRYVWMESMACGYDTPEIDWASVRAEDLSAFTQSVCVTSQNCFGIVLPYVQNLLLTFTYELLSRNSAAFPAEDHKMYRQAFSSAVCQIDDDIICRDKALSAQVKVLFFSLKYETDVSALLVLRNGKFQFNGKTLFRVDSAGCCHISNLDIEGDTLQIMGSLCLPVREDCFELVVAADGKTRYPVSFFEMDDSSKQYFCGKVYYRARGFKARLPLEGLHSVRLLLLFDSSENQLKITYDFPCILTNELDYSYARRGNYLFTSRTRDCSIGVEPVSRRRIWALERRVWAELLRHKHPKTLLWRVLIFLSSRLSSLRRKELWLFMDYFELAEDNAEDLYRYVLEKHNPNLKLYFIVSKLSSDYDRIKKYGQVIPFDSKRYRWAVANCDKIITCMTFFSRSNTFYHRTPVLKDLFHFDYVYLQHGVIKDNHANTLAHYRTALDMIITSAPMEYESLMTEEYQLSPKIVKLTGLARHDAIIRDRSPGAKKLLLAPTWRRLGGEYWEEHLQGFRYHENFKETEYFRFFNGLVTDPRVLDALERYDYELEIQMHPRIWQLRDSFTQSRRVVIEEEKRPVEEEVRDTVLLITDYSSIAFDYAYAGIPTLYAQFDLESFYSNHAYTRGYFDFEKDGFGPVCYDYESTVSTLLEIMKNGCRVAEEYQRRIDSFFAYRDGQNRERIYQELLHMSSEK